MVNYIHLKYQIESMTIKINKSINDILNNYIYYLKNEQCYDLHRKKTKQYHDI